jgi:superfamily II helicase
MQSLQKLNRQLAVHRERLITEVGLTADESAKVATLVATDISFLSAKLKSQIKTVSPVSIAARLDELIVFQAWMDMARSFPKHPINLRAQLLVQNYVCFVYLKDACFEVISKHAARKSVAARCASHLSRGAVRDFRNAFSHANWQYNSTYTGLECWVRKNPRSRSGSLRHFVVSQNDLTFWQALSRAVGYATYLQLAPTTKPRS